MDEEGARFDSGFDDGEPFPVSPVSGGVSLESALRDFGPAAIDDLLVRLRALVRLLDRAHARGIVHGALHPSNVIIADTVTSIVAGRSPRPPYAAPEVVRGEAATPAADQFSLAAITFEWLFARPIQGAAARPVEVRTMPGVDRGALSKAFTIALAPEPEERFASCNAFCDAVANAVIPELPLLAATEEAIVEKIDIEEIDIAEDDPVEPFVPEAIPPPTAALFEPTDNLHITDPRAPDIDDVKIVAEETNLTAAQPDLDTIQPPIAAVAPEPDAVASWNPSAGITPSRESAGFGGTALVIAALVGGVFGFAGGYMAKPRALQTGQAQTIAPPPTEDVKPEPSASGAEPGRLAGALIQPPVGGTSSRAEAPAAKTPAPSAAPTQAPKAPAPKSPAPAASAPASPAIGSLLVRSTPSGASVSVDGAAKGVTPLALRDLPAGTRTITLAHPGYAAETRKVQISHDRPSRSLEVRLAAVAQTPAAPAPAARPSTPATLGKPAASTGTLVVESRPAAASVSINGRDRGKTPLVIADLEPGEYQVVLTMPGYRNVATTVRVVAGERARAAASLTAVEQE